MRDQREVLMEEYDLSEKEADQFFESMKSQVMIAAQNADRDWNNDQYEAVTNVFIGLRNRQNRMAEEKYSGKLGTFWKYLPSILLFVGAGELVVGIWLLLFQYSTQSVLLSIIMILSGLILVKLSYFFV